ncbi:phosphatidylglycerophosphatase b [Ligilactobacillus hayakitensis DSM 18933 = JCM 14209]|uniref:Phosphatidylglycerophosphatase b n=1 Tax=Ligilactobacillus hayakitensis DSM 18933 = JCM 14209 TaxID=1423755 RepID=A0A0R1WP19_9LACO|nr:phosphatase PAP2 family protein [Ligilactobacillus hayakitensis]KRM19672.1 phosphatidylglycerophosphatase b [Ligilactobacillus hayakitensis DSM 18933 = JCM 14209]
MKISSNQKRPFYAGVFLLLFFILALLVKTHNPIILKFDHVIQNLLVPFTNPTVTKIVEGITFLGGPLMATIFSLIVIFYLYFRHNLSAATWASLTLIVSNLINYGIKIALQRPRPFDKLVPISGFSFPSGHTLGTTIFIFFVIFLVAPTINNQFIKKMVQIFGWIWIIIIAMSRIYLHVHYPSDTLASVILASFLWMISLICWQKFFEK